MMTNNYENINCEVMVDNLLNASMHDRWITSKTIVSIYPPRMFIAIILDGLSVFIVRISNKHLGYFCFLSSLNKTLFLLSIASYSSIRTCIVSGLDGM